MKKGIMFAMVMSLVASLVLGACRAPTPTPPPPPAPTLRATTAPPTAPPAARTQAPSPAPTSPRPTAAPTTPAPKAKPPTPAPKAGATRISYGTLGPPTLPYNLAVAQASILKKYTNFDVNVEPVGPARPQIDLMRKKEIELGLNDALAIWQAYRGLGVFSDIGKQQIRQLMTGHALVFGFATTAQSGIKTIADLKGKKVYVRWPVAPALEIYSKAVMGAHGMTFNDITALGYSGPQQLAPDLIEGKVDAWVGEVVARARMEEIERAKGAFIIPISHEPAVKQYIQKELPFIRPLVVPAGSIGAKTAVPTYGLPMTFYTRADVSDDMAYTIVKTLIEKQPELKAIDATLGEWTLENAITYPVMPFHPGAIKYFKERGVWTKEHEEMNNKLIQEGK